MLTGASRGSWDAIRGQEEILSKGQVWRLKGVWYSTRVQSLRADMGPEEGFPEGVRGDQGALEGAEQLKSVSLLCWAIWKMVWKT